jgi:hypothetical protein
MITWTCPLSRIFLIPLLLTFAPFTLAEGQQHEQKISTRLVAPWAPTPLIDEAAEFMAELGPSHYWAFLEGVFSRMDAFPPPTNGITFDPPCLQ